MPNPEACCSQAKRALAGTDGVLFVCQEARRTFFCFPWKTRGRDRRRPAGRASSGLRRTRSGHCRCGPRNNLHWGPADIAGHAERDGSQTSAHPEDLRRRGTRRCHHRLQALLPFGELFSGAEALSRWRCTKRCALWRTSAPARPPVSKRPPAQGPSTPGRFQRDHQLNWPPQLTCP
jgi:hypothetical protein